MLLTDSGFPLRTNKDMNPAMDQGFKHDVKKADLPPSGEGQ
jgi:hypothetical protein